MGTRADEVYAAHLRLGRFLPLPVVAVLALARAFSLSLLGGTFLSEDASAPTWVVVTRRSDGGVVGRLSAGREPYVGETLPQSVQVSMCELSAEAFLERWHLDAP